MAVEAISNIRTVVSLGLEDTINDKFNNEVSPVYEKCLKKAHFKGLIYGLSKAIWLLAVGACIAYGGHLVKTRGVEFKVIVKISELLIMGSITVGQSLANASGFRNAIRGAKNIFALLESRPQINSQGHVGFPQVCLL